MQDTIEHPIEYFISSWKSLYKGEIAEQRDTIMINNLKAIRVTFKNKSKNADYRQLIYLKKYSTLFEIINVNEATGKDFGTFCKSIIIEEYNRTEKH